MLTHHHLFFYNQPYNGMLVSFKVLVCWLLELLRVITGLGRLRRLLLRVVRGCEGYYGFWPTSSSVVKGFNWSFLACCRKFELNEWILMLVVAKYTPRKSQIFEPSWL